MSTGTCTNRRDQIVRQESDVVVAAAAAAAATEQDAMNCEMREEIQEK
jgi:hypothetical protein